jgi:hypothetical protein
MSGNIQTTYGSALTVALPGLRHSEEGLFTTKIAEGAISFGLGVKRGTEPDTQAIVGGGAGFLGIAVHSLAPEAAYADATINIEDTETFEVLRGGGIIWVSPTNAVAAGDKVVVVDSTGALKGGTAGAGQTQLDGQFESSASNNGLAKVNLNSNVAIPYVTATAVTTAKSLSTAANITAFTPLTAANGNRPYFYYVTSGILPVGLYLNPIDGSVSGKPTTIASVVNVIFAAKDAVGSLAATSSTVAITITA